MDCFVRSSSRSIGALAFILAIGSVVLVSLRCCINYTQKPVLGLVLSSTALGASVLALFTAFATFGSLGSDCLGLLGQDCVGAGCDIINSAVATAVIAILMSIAPIIFSSITLARAVPRVRGRKTATDLENPGAPPTAANTFGQARGPDAHHNGYVQSVQPAPPAYGPGAGYTAPQLGGYTERTPQRASAVPQTQAVRSPVPVAAIVPPPPPVQYGGETPATLQTVPI